MTANSVLGADYLVLIGTPELDFLPDLQKMLLISRSPPTAGTAGGTALGESPPLAPPKAPPPWAAALVTCRPWAWRRAAGRGRREAGTPGTEMWRAGWWAPLLLSLLQSVPGKRGPRGRRRWATHPRSRDGMWVLGHPGISGTLGSCRGFAWSQDEAILSLDVLSGRKGAGFPETEAEDI